MIKKVMLCVMLVFCFTVLGIGNLNGWSWQLQDTSELDRFITQINNSQRDAKKKGYDLCVLNIQKALSGKNQTNITYEQFKKIVMDNCELHHQPHGGRWVFFIIYNNKTRFGDFALTAFNDETINSSNNGPICYIFAILIQKKQLNYQQILQRLNLIESNPNSAFRILIAYQSRMTQFTKEENLTLLNKARIMIYPNLSESQNWKKAVVKLELMIKSLQ